MNRVKILPEKVANKIAAGEVVERPASVVKELMENAIDAGAKRITIETQAGGVGLMRVSDDGCGMSPDDAMLALERHATSKISDETDLASVQTLGFRGEAIPSIASVCRFELITKEKEAPGATCIQVEGGKTAAVKQVAHQDGTTVIVRDLFFNIPARRKFLKSHATENSHIAQTIRLAILSQQNVGFSWICDGEEMLNVPPSASLSERIRSLFEPEIAEQLLKVEKRLGLLSVEGFAGKPMLTRSNRNYQFFFVNGRPVQNRTLAFALKEAYHSLVMVDRQPVSFLFLRVPAQDVDVNVHPSKREVRFRQDAMIRDTVIAAVRDAVQGVEDMPVITPGEARSEHGPVLPTGNAGREDRVREAIAEYETTHSKGAANTFAAPAHHESAAVDFTAVQQQEDLLVAARPTHLHLVGQIHKLYLLLESSDGLVILDQHAAHERVLFDQVLKKLRASETVESQKLLLPVTIACDASQALLLGSCQDDLVRMGMEVREFGKNTFLVDAIPFFVKTSDIKTLVKDILDDLSHQEKVLSIGKAHEEKVLLTLCRIAVRARDVLNLREQQALVDQLMAAENPYHCPHGRPTMLKLSKNYLARQFKRV